MSAESSGSVQHVLEHYQQEYNWDCGVSCVIMLLPPAQRKEMITNFESICEEEGFKQSTWTIDLCYLLKRFGIKHTLFTLTLGVNESFRTHGYYDKIIHIDRDRVTQRFAAAERDGVVARRHALTHHELVEHLSRRGPAIVLVDAGLLVCDLCKHNKMKAEFRRCFGGSYSGHYIVVVGYSRNKLLYRDPALSPRLCAVGPARLARARRAPGTDHDIILIYNDYR
ncbi:protein GUCD1 [Anticarsia gemmatalis]|uniref:protein GUCD1 n=1 Tax=Anticarsia gemmatalis TaxID=129554 RepID=UPI003F76CF33